MNKPRALFEFVYTRVANTYKNHLYVGRDVRRFQTTQTRKFVNPFFRH